MHPYTATNQMILVKSAHGWKQTPRNHRVPRSEMACAFACADSEQKCSDTEHERLYGVGMDSELSNSLEAIANLLYLIGKSPDNPAAVSIYVGLAEDRLRVIAARYGPDSSPEGVPATCPASLPLMSVKSHNSSSDGMN
jgi:hypothetical protein